MKNTIKEALRAVKHSGPIINFLLSNDKLTLKKRLKIIRNFYRINREIECPHSWREMISFSSKVLKISKEVEGCIVEAGCFKGGSTSKFSIIGKKVNKRLVVFDSFEGIPENEEKHEKDIYGNEVGGFAKGDYKGSLKTVKKNIKNFGEIGVCEFNKGYFKETMKGFRKPISALYLDVDLASSTRTCLKHMWPMLSEGGLMCSQDGHLPRVVEVFEDQQFWEEEVGCRKPKIYGLRSKKLIHAYKRK